VKLILTDGDGTAATFSLTGPGTATLLPATDSSTSAPAFSFANTTAASKLTITTKGGDRVFTVQNIVSQDSLGMITGKSINLSGNLIVRGECKAITLANLVGGNQISTIGRTPTTLTFGDVKNTAINVNAAVKTLSVLSWTDDDSVPDVIDAPSIATIKSKANFQPSLTLTGADDPKFVAIKSASIKGSVGDIATWKINGNVSSLSIFGIVPVGFSASIKRDLAKLTVSGDFAGEIAAANIGTAVFKSTVSNAVLLAGADFGDDGVFAGADNTYAAGTIKSISVAGGVTNSTFAAGVDFNTNTLLDGGKITAASFKGTLSDDSNVLAKALPAKVKANGVSIDPTTDPRFQIG
jgi:hypothetical protein